MINTEAVTNNASNKLKLIKLDSKYEFIGKNLDTAIRTVKEMLDNGSQFSQNEYLSCYMGLKANGINEKVSVDKNKIFVLQYNCLLA